MTNVNLASLIYQESIAKGVPPAIALGVAQQESGIAQWTPSGNLVTGSAGEIGVFQLMPSTAAGLGVDPADVNDNVSGGVSLLAQLYQKYGNWPQALSAYNSGSPNGAPGYANSVLNLAAQNGLTAPPDDSTGLIDTADYGSSFLDSMDPNTLLIGGLLLLGLGLWALES